jgi:hypothetical protein
MFQPLWASLVTIGIGAATWRWAMFPFAAQAIVMVLLNPSSASMLPLGLIMFGIFATMCMVPAAIGATFGRKAAAP